MQSPKKGTVKKSVKKLDKYIADSFNVITENRKAVKAANKKTAKKEPQSDRKLKDQAGRAIKDFKKGLTDSFKPIVEGMKTVVPKGGMIKKVLGYKKGGAVKTKKKK